MPFLILDLFPSTHLFPQTFNLLYTCLSHAFPYPTHQIPSTYLFPQTFDSYKVPITIHTYLPLPHVFLPTATSLTLTAGWLPIRGAPLRRPVLPVRWRSSPAAHRTHQDDEVPEGRPSKAYHHHTLDQLRCHRVMGQISGEEIG